MVNSMENKTVFVTVGTTSFNSLISAVLQSDVLQVLKNKGYTDLNLQIGRGEEPSLPQPSLLKIVWYRLKDNISSDIQNASLVISHAGAGSCTEILQASKPLIVVVNDTLMGNHQVELAEQLHQDKHAHMCYPQTLCSALKEVGVNQFVHFPVAKTSNFSNFLESLMGFS